VTPRTDTRVTFGLSHDHVLPFTGHQTTAVSHADRISARIAAALPETIPDRER